MASAKGGSAKDQNLQEKLLTNETPSSSQPALEGHGGGEPASDEAAAVVEAGKWHEEVKDLLRLTGPIFVSMVSWVAMKTTDTALLGHSGTEKLSASAMSDLWTSSTGVFIQGGVLGTFCGQAFGSGNKKLAGIWLQVSWFVLFWVSLIVMASWACTGILLRDIFDVKPQLARDAQYYALVLMACIPARVGFSQLSQFFQSQRIMHPLVVCASVAMVLNLVVGLVLVLGIPVPGWGGYGFKACPIVTTCVEYFQLFLFVYVFCVRQKLHEPCWPGFAWEHITRARVVEFSKMYFPAALSMASDWWRVTVIGAIAASLGSVDLAVFNSSYRILWMCLIFVGSLAGATSIKLGIFLGSGHAASARYIASVSSALTLGLLVFLAIFVYSLPHQLAHIFSSDQEVIDLFVKIRVPLACVMVIMNLAVFLERIPLAMGRTKLVLGMGLIGSWVGQVPGVILCTQFYRHDLVGLYTGVAAGYLLLCVLYAAVIATSDWQKYADEARLRSEVSPLPKADPDAEDADVESH